MKTVAIYNMKGGVGKTTAAVNLSYLAAASGQRALLWDLDPQGASSFAFRVQPRVSGFGKRSLEDGQALGEAIKETDYNNLHLLPADFAYRKFDRFLDSLGKPDRLVKTLFDTLGRDYDVVFLDCPAGFSLLTEGVFAASDAILVPTIPTVFSLRTVSRLIKWADRTGSDAGLAVFFSMVDRRKLLHRRTCEWSSAHADIFLAGQIPYASVVEQMAVRRMPLPIFAPRDAATVAFTGVWTELQSRLEQVIEGGAPDPNRWVQMLQAVESLVVRLESADTQPRAASRQAHAIDARDCTARDLAWSRGSDCSIPSTAEHEAGEEEASYFVHGFDTEQRDLQRNGYLLELRERKGGLLIVAAQSGEDEVPSVNGRAHVQIDSTWALRILAAEMSPLEALERRLGRPGPPILQSIREIVNGQSLRRTATRLANPGRGASNGARADAVALTSHRPIHSRLTRTPDTPRLRDDWPLDERRAINGTRL